MKEVQIMTSALVAHFVCGNPGNPKEETHNKTKSYLNNYLDLLKHYLYFINI